MEIVIRVIWVILCGFVLHPPVRCETLTLSKYCVQTSMPTCTIRKMTYNNVTTKFEPEYLHWITEVQFVDSNLKQVPKVFPILPSLVQFTAQNCRIESIEKDAFKKAVGVKILDLTVNHIKDLPDDAFAEVPTLEDLRLGFNEIANLADNTFRGASNITDLIMNNNKVEALPVDVFAPLKNLEYINLEYNHIELIDAVTFRHNLKLKTLLLNNNQLLVFASSSLAHIPVWNLIDVSYNIIGKISLQSVHTLKATRSRLTECNITGPVTRLIIPNNDLRTVKISNPDSIRELDIRTNQFETLADFGELRNVEVLDASNNSLRDISTFSRMKSLKELRLANVNLNSKQENLLDLSQQITTLDLSENNLLHLNPEHLRSLKKLEKLYIDKNDFAELPYETLKEDHPSLSELSIAGNLFNCSFLANILKYCEKHDILLKVPANFVEWSSYAGVNCNLTHSKKMKEGEKKMEEKKDEPSHCENTGSVVTTAVSVFVVTVLLTIGILIALHATQYLTIHFNRNSMVRQSTLRVYSDSDVGL